MFTKLIGKGLAASLQHRALGTRGEQVAGEYLQALGWKVVQRNWRCRLGEIDLICREGSEVVFVEVKTRVASPYAEAALFNSIDCRKRRKLRQLVSVYLRTYHPRRLPPHRVDALGVLIDRTSGDVQSIRHLRAVVRADD